MTRVRLLLAYDGTCFHGFARQEGIVTVAGALCEAIEKLVGHEIDLVCAGRTDAGVHGWGQVVHFDTSADRRHLMMMGSHQKEIPADDPRYGKSARFGDLLLHGLQRSLNKLLAPEIVIREATAAPNDFDARHSAKARSYRYKILNRDFPDPFVARTAWHIDTPLEVAAMRLACDPLIGNHDFSAFCKKSPNPKATTIRRVLSADWVELGGGMLMFEISAYAFCHQMVRSLVGTMVDMGAGRLKAGEMAWIMRNGDRHEAGTVAPPQGLCLWHVEY